MHQSTKYNVVLVNYAKLVGRSEGKEFYRNHKFVAVFLDEGHVIKNKGAIHTACRNMKRKFSFLVTGTK